MLVRHIGVERSPLWPGHTRLRGEVSARDDSIAPEVYWFDVPDRVGSELSESGNAWLALLAPFAMRLGEPLSIPSPVDPKLYANIQELMRVWKAWYPPLTPVPIEADIASPNGSAPRRTAALFSGGVDAWFTLLTHRPDEAECGMIRIDELLCIWGLDISLDHPAEFRSMYETLRRTTAAFDADLIGLATNLHQTRWWQGADWGGMAHGPGLASVALALEHRYTRLLIPSTHRYDSLVPWGSHPLTDPLLSSSRTAIIHDGAGFSRVEKTEVVADFQAALDSLHVCWETKTFENCGNCGKCYRTMTALSIFDALQRCPTFPATKVEPAKLARVFTADASDRAFLEELRHPARQKDRMAIARAIDRSLARSRRVALGIRFAKWLATRRLIWRFAGPLQRWLLSRSLV